MAGVVAATRRGQRVPKPLRGGAQFRPGGRATPMRSRDPSRVALAHGLPRLGGARDPERCGSPAGYVEPASQLASKAARNVFRSADGQVPPRRLALGAGSLGPIRLGPVRVIPVMRVIPSVATHDPDRHDLGGTCQQATVPSHGCSRSRRRVGVCRGGRRQGRCRRPTAVRQAPRRG